MELGSYSLLELFCHKKSVRGSVTSCYISWLFLLETTSRARGGQLSHSLICDCHKKLLRCWIAGCRISSSLLRETPTGMELGSYSLLELFCHKKSVRGSVTSCYISWLFLLETTSRARGGQLSHSLTCDCHKKLLRCWIAGCRTFSSLLRETPTGMELGSYSLLDFLLSQ